jgi:tetratricopeptide (TPR) repeat protein
MTDTGPAAQKLHAALTALQQNRPDAAREAAELALEGFSTANDRTGAAAAHQVLAITHIMGNRLDDAMAHIDAAIPLRETTGDWEGVASLWQERFELCVRMGDLPAARAAGEQHVGAAEQTGDADALAHALHQLAQVVLQLGDDAAAEALVQRGLFSLDRPGAERGRAALQPMFATVWMQRKDFDKALSHAKQGLDLGRQAKNRQAEVDALQHIGTIHALRGEYNTAQKVLEEVLVGRELMKDVEGRANVLRELAGVEFSIGLHEEAFDRLDYAIRTLREAENWIGEITVLQLMQAMGDEHERPDKAMAAARALVPAAAATGDREAEAAAHFALATRIAGTGDLLGAKRAFEAAHDIQQGLGLSHEAAVSAGMMGQVLVAAGEVDEGLALLKGSLAQLDALGSEAADTVREILAELSPPSAS